MTRHATQALIIFCATVSLLMLALPRAALAQGASNKWTPWFEMGGKLSDELHNGEAELFVPLMGTDTSLLFVDFEGRLFEDSIRDGNFAVGYRQMTNTGFNAGVWVGYAPFRSTTGEVYHGIAGGLELLSHNFDLRINGYLPFDDDRLISRSVQQNFMQTVETELGTDQFPATGFILTDLFVITTDTASTTTTTVHEYAMRGIDGEIGALIPFTPGNFELRAYVGGYYFDADVVEEIAGFKSRLELRVLNVIPGLPGSRLTVDGAFRYDDVRDAHWYAGARLRIPLGGLDTTQTEIAALNGQERRMLDSINREDSLAQANTVVDRDVDVDVTRELAEDALTDVPFNQVALVANGADLQAAVNAVGGNTLIIANGGATNYAGITFLDNQTLMGGGGNILVRGQQTGVETGFDAPGVRPTIEALGNNNPGAIMANNTHIADLDIIGDGGRFDGVPGNHGVRGAGLTNVVVEELNISMMGRNGVSFDGGTDLLIFGNQVTDVFSNGINIRDDNIGVNIFGNMVSDVGQNGINVIDDNTNVRISNNIVDDIEEDGIALDDRNTNITITGNTVTNTESDGIFVDNNNTNITVTGNAIENVDDNGIEFDDDNTNVTIARNTITDTGDAGIEFDDDNTNVTISGNTITDVGGYGITFEDRSSLVTIAGNTILDTGSIGIGFANDSMNVSIIGNTITNTGNNGVDFGDGNVDVNVSGNDITNTGGHGIFFGTGTTVTVNANTVTDTASDGIFLDGITALTITNNLVTGTIGDDAYQFFSPGTIVIDGTGNSAAGAIGPTLLGPAQFICEGVGNFTGTLVVDGTSFVNSAGCG